MSEFINTIDALGDEVAMDMIIRREFTEFNDNVLTKIGDWALGGSESLISVNLPNVTYVGSHVFDGCTALTQVEIPSLTTVGTYCFEGCTSLERIEFPYLTYGSMRMLENCTALTSVYLPEVKDLDTNVFWGAKITCLDLPKLKSTYQMSFGGLGKLIALILRGETVVNLSSNAFQSSTIASGTGYIYVPRVLVEDYKVAANWSKYATQFRAIEDYTVDGTTTGDIRACTSITLNTTELTFTDANNQTLIPTFNPPPPYILGEDVAWTSDNRMVAKVSDGVVTPISDGTATITITCGDCSATCTVTVNAGLELANILYGVTFNTGYLNNNGAVGSTSSASDTYTNKFDISGYAGSSIEVQLIDVKNTASNSRICYYDSNNVAIGYTQASTANYGAVITSTVPSNAVYAAISVNKSSGFSAIDIYCDDVQIGRIEYTS